MAELQLNLFVSTEAEVEPDDEILELLEQRVADNTPLIPAEEAREQILLWLSKFSTNPHR